MNALTGRARFLKYVRQSGVLQDEVRATRDLDELLALSGLNDVLAVRPEHARRFAEALRGRAASPEVISAARELVRLVFAFQVEPVRPPEAAIAPAVPPPPPVAPAPKKPTPKAAIALLGMLIVATAVYTVHASRQAIVEGSEINDPDGKILAERRNKPLETGYLDAFLDEHHRGHFLPAPAGSCSPGALPDVQRGILLFNLKRDALAARALEHALDTDRNCVAAARVLANVYAQSAMQVKLANRVKSRADEDPHDSAAQLMMAYYEREAGNPEAYRSYLERASAAQANLPLLETAWATYAATYAAPRSVGDSLKHLQNEVHTTGDLGSRLTLVRTWEWLGEYELARQGCDELNAAAPDLSDMMVAMDCLRVAVEANNEAEEKAWLARYLATTSVEVGPSCMHADLAAMYANVCHLDAAEKQANEAISEGCVGVGAAQLRSIRRRQGRFEEAAQRPVGGAYWTNRDRLDRGIALAALGRSDAAYDVVIGKTERVSDPKKSKQDLEQQMLAAMLEDHMPPADFATIAACKIPNAAEALAISGGRYLNAGMTDEAQQRLDRALAMEPTNPEVVGSELYLLSVQGKVEQARDRGEQAMAKGLEGAHLIGNLGYMYQLLGDCRHALPLFERARHLMPLSEPNYTNEAKCLDALGRSDEAATIWRYTRGDAPTVHLWQFGLLAAGVVALYLLGKLALIKLLPARFGHMRFP